jgi:Arc/MetJ-type ribon-helix-helix transcriptional regulator
MGETKFKISISVDETTLVAIRKGIREGRFRNRSHAFEYAIQKVLEGEQ